MSKLRRMLCGLGSIKMGRFPQTAENWLSVYFTLFTWELKTGDFFFHWPRSNVCPNLLMCIIFFCKWLCYNAYFYCMCLKQYYTFYEQHGINTKVQKLGIFSITPWGIGSRDINVYLHKIPSFSVWEKNLKAEVTK